MIKIALLLSLLMFPIMGFSQKLTFGSFDDVFAQDTLNVRVDFSEAKIDGIKESSLLNIGGERADDWKRDKDDICSKFILALHYKIDEEMEVGRYDTAKYTLVFIPRTFDDDGEVRGYASIINQDGDIIATIDKINGDGGRFGSFTNLCEDAMERAGESVGRYLQREYRKLRREQRRVGK